MLLCALCKSIWWETCRFSVGLATRRQVTVPCDAVEVVTWPWPSLERRVLLSKIVVSTDWKKVLQLLILFSVGKHYLTMSYISYSIYQFDTDLVTQLLRYPFYFMKIKLSPRPKHDHGGFHPLSTLIGDYFHHSFGTSRTPSNYVFGCDTSLAVTHSSTAGPNIHRQLAPSL